MVVLAFCFVSTQWRGTKQEEWTTPEISKDEKAFWYDIDRFFGAYKFAFSVHHMGDIEGKRVALIHYDYKKIIDWLRAIEGLNPQSSLSGFLAAFYFSLSTNPEHKSQMCHYIEDYVLRDWQARWRWLPYAIYITKFDLRDLLTARKFAQHFVERNDTPLWIKEIHLQLMADLNQKEAAQDYIRTLLQSEIAMTKEERAFLESWQYPHRE